MCVRAYNIAEHICCNIYRLISLATERASFPERFPWKDRALLGFARPWGGGRTSQVPANSWSGRDLRWGEGKGLGEAHTLPPGSRGQGQGPKCAGRAWSAPRRLWGARSMAHGAACPFTALSLPCFCFGAMGQQNENLCHPRLSLSPDFGRSCFLFHRFGSGRGVRAG